MHDIYVCVKKKCEQRHFLQVLPEWKSYDSLPHVDLAESYPPAFQQTYVLSFPSGLAKTNFTLTLNQYFVLSKFQTPEVVSVKKIDISNLYCFLWFVHVHMYYIFMQPVILYLQSSTTSAGVQQRVSSILPISPRPRKIFKP